MELQVTLDTENYSRQLNGPEHGAMLSVREERAVVGGVEVARKTVMAATDEGLVSDLAVYVSFSLLLEKYSS